MIKFFRKIRYNLMERGKTGKYFKYAIGEIVLVVIGILIALSINNWNNNRIKRIEHSKILKNILHDIENDIQELSNTIALLDSRKPVFDKVRNDSITVELLDQGLSRILSYGYSTTLNLTGVRQLKEITKKDSLSMQIIETYDQMENFIIRNEKRINDESINTSEKLREYPWYGEWMSKTITKDNSSKELQNYFLTSIEYKNLVFYFYQIIYNNYYFRLKASITNLKNIQEHIEIIIEDK